MDDLIRGGGRVRCGWCGTAPEYVAYHDDEWGRPVTDDRALFEKMCLEGFQSGLSWLTILRKRDGFRRAFAGFDIERVEAFGARDVDRLLADAGIVRHRGKIEAAIANAAVVREIQRTDGSFASFVWSFAPSRPAPAPRSLAQLPASTEASAALARALRRRGARFVGPTTMYALMQAMGIVNDHLAGCDVRAEVDRERARVPAP